MILLIGLSNLIVIYVGGKQYLDGTISNIGIIAEFIIYVNMLTWPVASLGWISSIIQQAEASQRRINEFLKEKSEIKNYIQIKKKTPIIKNEYLITTIKGEKTYPMLISRIVKKNISQLIDSENYNPHLLRHTFATHILNRGADLNSVKDLLGHSSLAATQIYTHNSIEKLKKTFEKAHPKAE